MLTALMLFQLCLVQCLLDKLRNMMDKPRDKAPNMIAVVAGVNGDSGTFVVSCGKEAVAKGAHAGKIVQKVAAIIGGKAEVVLTVQWLE